MNIDGNYVELYSVDLDKYDIHYEKSDDWWWPLSYTLSQKT